MTDVTIEVTETPIDVDVSVTETPVSVSVSPTSTPVEVSISAVSTPVSIAISATSTPIEVGITVNEAISNHDELDNLAYADAGHTGFQPAGDYLQDAPSDGLTYGRKDAAWAVVTGITDHSALSNLDYASAGHTGFQSSLVADTDYLTPGTAATTYLKLDASNDPITGALVHQNAVNSTTAFQIKQSDGTVVGNWDTTNNRLGIGVVPDFTLHVQSSSTTVIAPNANHDDIVIDNNGSAGITIRTPNIRQGSIAFADQFANNSGQITYDHNVNRLQFITNGSEKLRILSTGSVAIGAFDAAAKLHVKGTADDQVAIFQANATQTAALVQHNISTTVHNEFFVPHASNLYTTVFNKQGSPLLDFKVLSDNYDALFIDASEDSIDIMHNTGGKVGFYATAPTVQQVLATGAGTTVDNVITALQALGLVKQA